MCIRDSFTGKPIDVSTGIAKTIKPKKETIAQRKAKLLGGKAVSFASVSYTHLWVTKNRNNYGIV